MHLVVDNMSHLPEVNGIDDFIVPILLISIEVLCLAAVPCGG
jgi:hypothetical protein